MPPRDIFRERFTNLPDDLDPGKCARSSVRGQVLPKQDEPLQMRPETGSVIGRRISFPRCTEEDRDLRADDNSLDHYTLTY